MSCKKRPVADYDDLQDVPEKNIVVSEQYDLQNDPDYNANVVQWMKEQLQKEVDSIAAKGMRVGFAVVAARMYVFL